MSPELEALDQLLGGDMPLGAVRKLFETDEHFARAIARMLHSGEIRLQTEGVEIPQWRWSEILAKPEQWKTNQAHLRITDAGVRRIE